MNLIEQFKTDLAKKFPNLILEIDEPKNNLGSWFLDIQFNDKKPPIIVEWRPNQGFGVSHLLEGDADYGIGPDEVFDNLADAFNRVVKIITSI